MSESKYFSISTSISLFCNLPTLALATVFLASCGGGGQEPALATESASVGTKALAAVPNTWAGRVPLPQSTDIASETVFNGISVAASQVVILPKPNRETELDLYIKNQGYTVIAKSRMMWQVNIASTDIAAAIEKIDQSGFASAIPNEIVDLNGFASTDPFSRDSSGFNWALDAINAHAAWGLDEFSNPVKIGVLDGGFRFGHEDIQFSKIHTGSLLKLPTDNWDPSAYCLSGDGALAPESGSLCERATHGMHVSSIISATGDNGLGLAGVAWMNKLKPIAYNGKSSGSAGIGAGLAFFFQESVSVVNISLGWTCKNTSCSRQDANRRKSDYRKILQSLKDFYPTFPDVVIVQAAGNNGEKTFSDWSDVNIYSDYSGLFATIASGAFDFGEELNLYANSIRRKTLIVGAHDKQKSVTSYTSRPSPTSQANYVYAPGGVGQTRYISVADSGENIAGAAFSGTAKYVGMSGTSIAAPHVSGVAALMGMANKSLSAEDKVEIIIKSAATDTNGRKYLNAEAAVREALRRKNAVNCGTVTEPYITTQGNLPTIYQVTAGRPATFTAIAAAKLGYPFARYLWTTSEGVTATSFATPDVDLTFTSSTVAPKALAQVSVTPVLADGTECREQAKTSKVNVLPAAQAPTNGLIGRYTFDDCLGTDSSGQGRTAAISGYCVAGKASTGLEFRNPGYNTYGGSNSMEIPVHTEAGITFSTWVNWKGSVQSNDSSAFAGALWSIGTWGIGPFTSIWVNEGGVAGDGGKIWTDRFADSPYRLVPGVWAMLTLTSDGTKENLYLDGQLIKSVNYSVAVSYKGQPSFISRHFWSLYGDPRFVDSASRFRGIVDDVRVYDRSLSATEIRDLYLATK